MIEKQTPEMETAINMFKRNVVKAAEVLVSLLKSKDDMVKLEAAIYILDRVYGKPVQIVAEKRGPKNST
jgi:esterase/lipase